jgi:hypothetical protein
MNFERHLAAFALFVGPLIAVFSVLVGTGVIKF